MTEPSNPGGERSAEVPKAEIVKRVARSENPVVHPGEKTRLQTTEGGTILVRSGTQQISLFDIEAKAAGETTTLIADWETYRSRAPSGGVPTLARDDNGWDAVEASGNPSVLLVTDSLIFPESIQPSLKTWLGTDDSKPMPLEPWKIDLTDLSNVTVTAGKSTLMVYQQGTDSYIIFETKGVDGTPLSPRNWKRIDTLTAAGRTDLLPETREIVDALTEPGLVSITATESAGLVRIFADRVETDTATDNLSNVGNNVTEDPSQQNSTTHQGVIYYCSATSRILNKLDTRKTPPQSETVTTLPDTYGEIHNLRIDRTGNFLTFSSSHEGNNRFVVLNKETLAEVTSIPDLAQGVMDEEGKIHGIDREGHVGIYELNLTELANQLRAEKLSAMSEAAATHVLITAEELAEQEAQALETRFQYLQQTRTENIDRLMQRLNTITDVGELRERGTTAAQRLVKALNLTTDEQDYMLQGIQAAIRERQTTLAQPIVQQALTELQTLLAEDAGVLNLDRFREARRLQRTINAHMGYANDPELTTKYQTVAESIAEQSEQFETIERQRVIGQVTMLVARISEQLAGINNLAGLNTWLDNHRRSLEDHLLELRTEALTDDVQETFSAALKSMQRMSAEKRLTLRTEHRTGRAAIIDAKIDEAATNIDDFLLRLTDEHYETATEVLASLGTAQYTEIEESLDEFMRSHPHDAYRARELRRKLKASIALLTHEIERDKTGEEEGLVSIGGVPFAIFEPPPKLERPSRELDLTFIRKQGSKDVDVAVKITTITHKEKSGTTITERTEEIRTIYQEGDNWAIGETYRGAETGEVVDIPMNEYKDIRKKFREWQGGDLKQQVADKRKAIHETFQQRPVILADGREMTLAGAQTLLVEAKTNGEDLPRNEDGKLWTVVENNEWKETYKEAVEAYGEFAAENHIVLFEHLDKMKEAPDTDEPSSLGYVPAWEGHWIVGPHVEENLEYMSQLAKQQLRLKEGVINLKGHAGTGKDVLVKMFAHLSNRPLFTYDANKWTTPEELSETSEIGVTENGVLTTIHVPSWLVKAVQTPGSILYLNEFNNMDQNSQIFLHALFDKSRRMQLTKSGGSINADNILCFTSMNPGYVGTFAPGPATKSRMQEMEITYPPLHDDPDNPRAIGITDALQIARGVKSLEGMTYDFNLDRNHFVQHWNKEINNDTAAAADIPELDSEQEHDMRTIAEVVKISAKLREAFVKSFGKRNGMNVSGAHVTLPITAREFARIGDWIGDMNQDEKAQISSRKLAIELIDRVFLSHFDDPDQRRRIRDELPAFAIAA